ncbi:tRNA lysidine(34) synthetase TilS [Achromobacter sp. UMC71]|nr:tRNA lysidine(34) synthetase TilS [Achromobacter sp. UMC71]MBB1628868.1 tRNA lysidine(34) synthetase TilS [Achromobacter sp. UMC71]
MTTPAADADPLEPAAAEQSFPFPVSPELIGALRRALACLPQPPARIAVAVSGGADSAMLAVHAAALARAAGLNVVLFHVHHGLQAAADGWTQQVQSLADLLGLPLRLARVQVDEGSGKGIEAAARDARYAALARLAQDDGVALVLLAHHRNDQAETVLLRLLRGTGLAGMAAMAAQSERDGVVYLRPWLEQGREAILQAADGFASATGWHPVQDPTNADPRYTRAALRELLAPVLDGRWPGWRAIVARHARHMAEAAEILDEVAREDLAGLEPSPDGASFSLAAWRRLSPARQAQALRYWLAQNGARMPTDARLRDLLRQLRELHSLGHDRQLRVEQAGHVVRCHRGRVWIEPRPQAGADVS